MPQLGVVSCERIVDLEPGRFESRDIAGRAATSESSVAARTNAGTPPQWSYRRVRR